MVETARFANSASFRQHSAHCVVRPRGSARSVAHGRSVAFRIVVRLARRSCGAARQRDAVVAVFDWGGRAVVVALAGQPVQGVIPVAGRDGLTLAEAADILAKKVTVAAKR